MKPRANANSADQEVFLPDLPRPSLSPPWIGMTIFDVAHRDARGVVVQLSGPLAFRLPNRGLLESIEIETPERKFPAIYVHSGISSRPRSGKQSTLVTGNDSAQLHAQ